MTTDRHSLCPACGVGRLEVTVQLLVTLGEPLSVDSPTTDDFVSASCTNQDCHWSLEQDMGDGRLRRAGLSHNLTDMPDAEGLDAWIEAVRLVIEDTPRGSDKQRD